MLVATFETEFRSTQAKVQIEVELFVTSLNFKCQTQDLRQLTCETLAWRIKFLKFWVRESFLESYTCMFSISTTPGSRIKLTFPEFYLPRTGPSNCKMLFLNIIDGPKTSANHFCGANPKRLVSKTNQLQIVLRSDADPDGRAAKTFVLKVEKTSGTVN